MSGEDDAEDMSVSLEAPVQANNVGDGQGAVQLSHALQGSAGAAGAALAQ